jgi:hypothetical protein
MPKRKFKEELKKEDFFLSTFNKWKIWITEHRLTCLIAAIVAILIGLSGWAFAAYQNNRNEKAQYLLSSGIRSFQEYLISNKADVLPKAEADFKKVLQLGSGGLKDSAQLYLARIAAIKGNKQEAKALYTGVAKKPSNDISKKLAEKGLQSIAQTQ